MLNDFLFCVNAVLPMFFVIGAGFFLRCKEKLDGKTIKKLNWIVFNLAIPAMMIRDISGASLDSMFDPVLVCYCVAVTVISFILVWCFAEIFIKDKMSIGAFVQGSFRSNYLILGLVLVAAVMGNKAQGKGALALVAVIPLYNILSILVLSVRGRKHLSGIALLKSSLMSILRNPIILSIVFSLPFSYFHCKIPSLVNTVVYYFANLTTPLALLVLGGSLDFSKLKASLKITSIAAFIKLVLIPAVFVSIAVVFLHMRDEELLVVAAMCGSPSAVSGYIMASQMGSDEFLAANIILVTTMCSAITFTLGLYFFRLKGYI